MHIVYAMQTLGGGLGRITDQTEARAEDRVKLVDGGRTRRGWLGEPRRGERRARLTRARPTRRLVRRAGGGGGGRGPGGGGAVRCAARAPRADRGGLDGNARTARVSRGAGLSVTASTVAAVATSHPPSAAAAAPAAASRPRPRPLRRLRRRRRLRRGVAASTVVTVAAYAHAGRRMSDRPCPATHARARNRPASDAI